MKKDDVDQLNDEEDEQNQQNKKKDEPDQQGPEVQKQFTDMGDALEEDCADKACVVNGMKSKESGEVQIDDELCRIRTRKQRANRVWKRWTK